MDKIDLDKISTYSKGEKLSSEILNRPINQLDTNIINQKSVLDKVVDLINSFEQGISAPVEYDCDGDQTKFDIEFYKKSINVYLDGVLVKKSHYNFDYSDDRNVYGTSITFNDAPDKDTLLNLAPIDVIKMWAGGTSEPLEYIGDGDKKSFEIEFYKDLITVYMDGLLLKSDEYTLNYKDDDGIHGISVSFSDAPANNAWLQIVTVG